jgi:hypothetical protein
MVLLLYCLRRGLGLKDGPGSARASTVSVWLRWWGSSSRHRPGQVLADLASRAKVVQTVGCSTFTRGAKPATRRVADGERMNPQGKGGAFAPVQKTTGTKATSHDGRQASDHRRRARCVPDRPAIRGISRLLRDRSPIYLTCDRADQPTPADDLLSSRSHARIPMPRRADPGAPECAAR